MKDRIRTVKKKLNDAIAQLCEVSWMFCRNPDKDFTRSRKLPFREIISFLLTMEGGTLATELLKYFGCSCEIASTSAFVQQRKNSTQQLSLRYLTCSLETPMKIYYIKGYD